MTLQLAEPKMAFQPKSLKWAAWQFQGSSLWGSLASHAPAPTCVQAANPLNRRRSEARCRDKARRPQSFDFVIDAPLPDIIPAKRIAKIGPGAWQGGL